MGRCCENSICPFKKSEVMSIENKIQTESERTEDENYLERD